MTGLQTFIDTKLVLSKKVHRAVKPELESTSIIKEALMQPLRKKVTNKQINNKNSGYPDNATARYYEMDNGVIHESFLKLEDDTCGTKMLSGKNEKPSKDLIVVISDDLKIDELSAFYKNFKNRLKFVIHYGNNTSIGLNFKALSPFMSVNSLKKAVSKSYKLAQNGQTIFFPRTVGDFDFFRHIDFA